MKHLATPIYFSLLLVLAGCGAPQKRKLEALMEKRDSLLQVNSSKDTLIHSLTTSFNEIENNLDMIRKRESLLKAHVSTNGDVTDKRKEINSSINEINDLMTRNSNKIHALNKQLANLKFQNTEYSKMVDLLAGHVVLKNDELQALSEILGKKNKQIDRLGIANLSLAADYMDQRDTISLQRQQIGQRDSQLNTVYFLVGNKSELKEMHVLDSHNKLSSDFNKDYFTQIDAREETFIPGDRLVISGIKKILTKHPSDSYEFLKNDQGKMVNIKINDQKRFWSLSKFLILEAN